MTVSAIEDAESEGEMKPETEDDVGTRLRARSMETKTFEEPKNAIHSNWNGWVTAETGEAAREESDRMHVHSRWRELRHCR